ncbi:MAG: hypothetical protein ACK4JX_05335 [Flavobacterium sp.]
MKKSFLLIVMLVTSTIFAQENEGLKGTWWAAGQLSFDSEKTGDLKTSSNFILPIAGYFIAPTTTVGLGIGTINSETKNGSTVVAESTAFVVKPLIRKYWNVSGNLYFYGQASIPFVSGKDKVSNDKFNSFGLELTPGLDLIVNKWMTIEASFDILSITSVTETPNAGEKTTSFGFNANPLNSVSDRGFGSLRVGVKFLF